MILSTRYGTSATVHRSAQRPLYRRAAKDVYPVCKGDVVSHHFLGGPESYDRWCRTRPPLSPSRREAKARADKQMAHVTRKLAALCKEPCRGEAEGRGRGGCSRTALGFARANPELPSGARSTVKPSSSKWLLTCWACFASSSTSSSRIQQREA